ncbi:MAG: hypothetical protein K8S23_15510 [Candidatus Cloacimonetes bacterium]|nr:hypothetical protein [Candidatus Cloacimonadota bacterium]
METFIEPKELVKNSYFQTQKKKSLSNLINSMIDSPIVKFINGFNSLPYCFTLQCCFGHFLYIGQDDSHNLEPLPYTDTIDKVDYRIAYIAFCIKKNTLGKALLTDLNGITAIDQRNIQFGCAEWFWKRQVNSYVLQVEPDRFKLKDKAILEYKEALHIEKIRYSFFYELDEIIRKRIKKGL